MPRLLTERMDTPAAARTAPWPAAPRRANCQTAPATAGPGAEGAGRFAGRGAAQVINEFPDLDLAVRALVAVGPSWPAVQHAGQDRFAEAMREALSPLYAEGLGVRIVSEFGWVIGTVPSA